MYIETIIECEGGTYYIIIMLQLLVWYHTSIIKGVNYICFPHVSLLVLLTIMQVALNVNTFTLNDDKSLYTLICHEDCGMIQNRRYIIQIGCILTAEVLQNNLEVPVWSDLESRFTFAFVE